MDKITTQSRENQRRLFLVKLIHTAIWIFFVVAIFYVVYCGIADEIGILTWLAAGAVVLEAVVLALFGMYCPLTLIARKYSDSEKDNFDIFLPNWLARHNKVIFTSIFLTGLLLVVWRTFQ